MFQTCTPEPQQPRRDRGIIRPIVTGGVIVGSLTIAAGYLGFELLDNPIRTETVDHSPAPILTELRDLAEFHAAAAEFEVIVDEEQDVNLVPQFIAGERVQFVAIGSVDAVVDFTTLGEAAVVVGAAPEPVGDAPAAFPAVTITIPSPVLAEPAIDHEQSHVMNRDRGIVNRLGGALVDNPTSEHDLLIAASAKMAAAAARTDLVERAETNTAALLDGMLASLGYTDVTVVFSPVVA